MQIQKYTKAQIIDRRLSELTPNPHNAMKHPNLQIRELAGSITQFGFVVPILIDRNGRIIAGHARAEAAKLLGMEEVPTILLDNLTENQIRAFMLADNKLAEKAVWDPEILAIELQHLAEIDEFDVTITGFDIGEIDSIVEATRSVPDEDEVVQINETAQPITQPNDLWKLGRHRLLCGDALQESSFARLMAAHRAHLVFVDCPYNLRIDGNVCGKGSIHHREFAMASGEMSPAEFVAFLTTALRLLSRFSISASVHFICMDWRHIGELLAAGNQIYSELLNLCVWVKNAGGMGSLYRSQHELIFVFKNDKGRHRNNVMLGKYQRNRTNVWEYPGVNSLSRQGDEGNLLALHPTCKPVNLVADALLDCSARGDIILDSFLGSGTTLIASERVGRVCYGMELDARYVDVAIRRWQKHTGDRAIHAETGEPFDERAAQMEASHGR
jgi:DNA modification methylase